MSTTPKHPSTYDRLLARERLNVTPAPASGSSAGVIELAVVVAGQPTQVRITGISLTTKEACTHPRLTRTGRCFWCGVIVSDLA